MTSQIKRILQARARERLPEPSERRRLREEAELTAEEFAEALGVSESTIHRWEAGTREPQRKHRAAYVEALRALEELAS